MTVSATTVTQYYTGIFRQAPSAAVSAAYQAMANDNAALNSMLSAANLQVDPVVRLYQTAFNRLPDTAGLTAWVVPFSTGQLALQTIANGFTQSTEFTNLYPTTMSNAQYVGALYFNILQRQGEDAGIAGWVNALNSGALTRAQVLLGFSDSAEFRTNITPAVNQFLTNIANTPVANQGDASLYTGTLFDLGGPSTTYTLTTNPDTFGNATLASKQIFVSQPGTFTAFDNLTGGTNTADILTVNSAVAYAGAPAGASVTGIENVTFNLALGSGAGTPVSTAAGTGFTGVNNLTVNSLSGPVDVIAAGTTAVTLNNTPAANAATIDGGSNVTANVTGTASGTLTIGGTTAPTGAINVSYLSSAAASGTITTTGGTSVNILSAAASGTTTNAGGAVSVTTVAGTTSVSVLQSAANALAPGAGNIVNGQVTISAGTAAAMAGLTTVTLSNYANTLIGGGGGSANALTTLNLSSYGVSTAGAVVASGTLGVTTTATSMNLNLTASSIGASLGAITFTGNTVATLNTVMSGNVTLAGVTDTGLRTITLGGTGVLTMTAFNTAVTALTLAVPAGASTVAAGLSADVSGAAGLTAINFAASTANNNLSIAATQSYAGGSGNDQITLAAAPTLAVTGGAGSDTIVLNAAAATFTAVSMANVTGFETLGLFTGSTGTFDLVTLGQTGITAISLIGDAGAGVASGVSSVTAGTALNINAAQTGTFTYQLAGNTGASSSVNVTTNIVAGGAVAFGTLVLQDAAANGIGTVNISANDANAAGVATVGAVHTFTALTDNALGTLNLSGTAAVSITNAISTSAAAFTLTNNSTSTGASTLGGLTAVGVSLSSLSYSGTHATTITTLDTNQASITLSNTGTGLLTITTHSEAALTSLTLNGDIAITTGTYATTSAATISGASNNADVSVTLAGATGIKTVTLGNGDNTVVTGAANDVITVGTGANIVTGAAGADAITLGAGITDTAASTVVQGTTDSVVVSTTLANANFAAGDVLAFANGIDVVTGFTAGTGGDVLDVAVAALAVTGIGVANNTLVAGTNYFLSGTWNAASKTFTVAADGVGADTIIVQGYAAAGTDIDTNASGIVLVGVDSDSLVAGNFA